MAMSANEALFHEGMYSILPGKEKVRTEGALFREARHGRIYAETAKNHVEGLVNRLAPGQSGVRHDGDLYGMIRRTEAYAAAFNAQLAAVVGALKAVTGGDTFDEAKLLESIARVTKESFDAALKDAAPAEVTLTVEKEG